MWGAAYSDTNAQTPTLESVTLSKNSVPTWCPFSPDGLNTVCGKQEVQIEVVSVVKNPNNEPVNFIYVVTGGEIVGSGPHVIWDLHKAPPGKHSITVGLGEGIVVRGKTITKPVQMVGCPVCDRPCECLMITLTVPDTPITMGDAFIVEATVQGTNSEKASYKWSVSVGTIVEGHRTSRILVRTDSDMKANTVTVSLEIGGTDPACNCRRTFSEQVPIAKSKP